MTATVIVSGLSNKPWIQSEGKRNRDNAMLYVTLITKAYGVQFEMFIGHHLAYKSQHDAKTTLDEIPSADTLLFDHEIMTAVFGQRAIPIMQMLAAKPCGEREQLLETLLARGQNEELCPYQLMETV